MNQESMGPVKGGQGRIISPPENIERGPLAIESTLDEQKTENQFGSLLTIAASLFLAFASGAIQIGGDEKTLVVARNFARSYLANPDKQTFPIYGDSKLLVPCLEPRVEDEFVSHGKLRYDFKVTCANEKIGYLFVSMRGKSIAFIGVSRESPVVGKQ